MKLWHKVMLISLLIFIISIDISTIIILQKSRQLNINLEVERAYSEQTLIANNIYENFNAILSRGAVLDNDIIYEVISSYSSYYDDLEIELQLRNDETVIFPKMGNLIETNWNSSFKIYQENDNHYIQIIQRIPEPHNELLLSYKRNINSIYEMNTNLNRIIFIVNIFVGLVLVIILSVVTKRLIGPISKLSKMTGQIADGNYSERVNIVSKDEIGELANNFNKMASSVENHMGEVLQMAEKKQNLVDNMAHELKTPLTSMYGFADYLLNANSSDEDRIIAGEYIKSETMRLSQLSSKLLYISNLQYENIQLESISSADLFQHVKELERANLELQNQKLVIDNQVSRIKGEFDLLVSFLTNCIENSMHASKPGEEIILSSYSIGNEAILQVKDNGSGMKPEEIENIFEPFYRADKSRSRKHGGAGLGLTLCKQIADALGAKINLQSKWGQGTVVQIILQVDNK